MKHKLMGLAALGAAIAVVLVARPSAERLIAGVRTIHQDVGAKDKDRHRDEDRDDEKSRVLRPRFTVSSSKEAYDPSERIKLALKLSLKKRFWSKDAEEESSQQEVEHQAPSTVTVETFEAGTISVVSATRNGKSINPTEGFVNYHHDPVPVQIASLETISPGDHVRIPFTIPGLSGQGSRLIVEELNPGSEHIALIYSLQEPGWYTLQFRYHYTGPDDGKPNVFRGELLSNQVSFLLREVHKKGQLGTGDAASVAAPSPTATSTPGLGCDMQTDPDNPESVAMCQNIIAELQKIPSVASEIEVLQEVPTTQTFTVSDDPDIHTVGLNAADAYAEGQTTPGGNPTTGNGSDSIIYWNPDIRIEIEPIMDPGVFVDPVCAAAHEVHHAYVNASGGRSRQMVPGTCVEQDEVDATEVENDCRRERNLPVRAVYCDTCEDGTRTCAKVRPTIGPTVTPGKSPGN